ncbi:MAG TPA: HNH endonuclease signature motif containing protein [Roseateles sp.]|uniref:HNH endonuclease n=1 Tax=Roseateles sp. TaxID=1971397 RepID=UPI002ED9692D
MTITTALTRAQKDHLEDVACRVFSGRLGTLAHGFRVQNDTGQPVAVYWSDLAAGNAVEIAVAPNRLTDKYDAGTTLGWLEVVRRENPAQCKVHKEGSGWPIFGLSYEGAISFLKEIQLLGMGFLPEARRQQIEALRRSRGPEEAAIAKLKQQRELLRPTRHHAVIDLVRSAGISVKCWFETKEGGQVANPRANPAYRSNWAFGGKGEPALASLWYDSIESHDGFLELRDNFRADATARERVAADRSLPEEQRSRARIQGLRARELDDLVRGVGEGGSLRVIINEGVMRDEAAVGLETSHVKVRRLDDVAWTVQKYDVISGSCVLRRSSGEPTQKPPEDVGDKFIDQHDLPGSDNPEQLEVKTKAYPRDAAVRLEVLLRAQGHCEHCDAEGFRTSDGRMYLETHHIVPLAERGVDRVWNVIGLCPGHHREAHHGARRMEMRDEFKELMRQAYGPDVEFAASES